MSADHFATLRTAPDGCLSDLALDRLRLGELEGQAQTEARAHLTGCSRCRARAEAIEVDAAQATSAPDLELRTARLQRDSTRRRFVRVAGSLVSAAAVLAVVVLVQSRDDDGFREKGGDSMALLVKRTSGGVERLGTGARLREKDAVRFALTFARPGWVVVVGLDARHAVTAYVPERGPGLSLPAGRDHVLPGAVELDAALGPERFVAVVCDFPITTEWVVARAQAAVQASQSAPESPSALGTGCRELGVVVEKVR